MRRARNVTAALGRRPLLAAALLYAVASLAMVGPGLIPGRTLSSSDFLWTVAPWQDQRPDSVRAQGGSNFELADTVAAFGPFTRRVRSTLPSVALWNPDIAAGRPLLANMQSGVFSPFNVPSYVLPYWWSLGIVAALKLFAAALGTFMLARALAIGFAGSLLAGLAFGLSLYMVTWVAWPLASVWALLPWLLVAVDRVVRKPDALGVAGLGVVTGLSVFAGHPESTFHALIAAVAFGLLRLSRTDGQRVRRSAAVALGLLAGAGLAAVVILPFLELVGQSGDLAHRADTQPGHLLGSDAWGLLFPEYFGRATQTTTRAFINQRALYDGALPLLLAVVALARPSRERVAIAVAGLLALGIVFGVWPLFELMLHVPALNRTLTVRLGILVCLAIALLAGWGLDDILAAARRRGDAAVERRYRWLVPALVAAVALPVVIVVAGHHAGLSFLDSALGIAIGLRDDLGLSHLDAVLPTASALAWLIFAGLGSLLIVLTVRGRIRPPLAATLAIALVAVDLMRFGLGENPSITVADARQPATPAIQKLQTRTPARYVGVYSPSGAPVLPADNGMTYGLQDARSYDYPVVGRYDRLWRAAVAPHVAFVPPTTLAATTPAALRALSLLGVRSLLQDPRDAPLTDPSLRLTYDGPDARIYDNTRALPRAWIVGSQQPVAGGEGAQLRAIQAPGFRPASTVVVGTRLDGIPTAAAGDQTTASPARPARIDHYGAEHVQLTATAPRRSVVVLSDIDYPGWHATVDGHDAPIHRVDYLLRGVTVGPGTHRVSFTYRPASYRIGWIISALTALILAAAVWHSRRARRRVAA